MILDNISITVNAVDLSSSLRGLVFTESNRQEAAEAHGDDWMWFEKSLQGGNVTAQFWQDYSTGGVDDTISGLMADVDGFTVVILPNGGTPSGTNPSFTATMSIESYERFTGEVGDRAVATVAFVLAANTGFVRATS